MASNDVKKLKNRPVVPTIDQIAEDLRQCGKNDCVFDFSAVSYLKSGDPSFVTEDADNITSTKTPPPTPLMTEEKNDADLELVYKKATQFITLTEQLKSAPDTLKDRTQYLEKLGEDLVESIGKLKVQAQQISHSE